jgi:hypothetical protein
MEGIPESILSILTKAFLTNNLAMYITFSSALLDLIELIFPCEDYILLYLFWSCHLDLVSLDQLLYLYLLLLFQISVLLELLNLSMWISTLFDQVLKECQEGLHDNLVEEFRHYFLSQ